MSAHVRPEQWHPPLFGVAVGRPLLSGDSCVTCNASRVVFQGRNVGGLWCQVKSSLRAPSSQCDSWLPMVGPRGSQAATLGAGSELPHRVQVNSGVGSQFGTEAGSGYV